MKNEETIADKEKNDLALIVGSRIRAARKNADLSQEKLAELADLHPTYIGQLERGEKNATLESIHKVTRALGIPLDFLFEKIDADLPTGKRNYPLECYDLILSLPLPRQEKMMQILIDIENYRNI